MVLTNVEKNALAKIRIAMEVCGPTEGSGEPPWRIRAQLIRDLLLNLPIDDTIHDLPRAGMRFENIIIEGRLNLDEMNGVQSDTLPSLTFKRCQWEGGLSANNTKIQSLRLHYSSFRVDDPNLSAICIDNTIIDGTCNFSHIGPIESDQPCRISARNSEINGSLLLTGSRLICPYRDNLGVKQSPRYALNLLHAKIHGDFECKIGLWATGGVSLLKATVCGNIWLIGCCIEAGEGYALNLQGTICEGGLVVRASRSVEGDSDQKCYLNGGIHGLGAAISDGLYIEGITLGLHPYEDKQASLNITVGFPKAQIGRGVSITHFYKSNTKPIRGICECPIIFDDACIDGNLCFYGLAINSGLYLRRTKIKGNLEMKCTLLPTELFEAIVRRGVDLTHACIEGDTFLYGVEIEGDFRATDASFGGNIILSCLATSEKENNYLPFSVHHVIFQRGVVRGTMALQGCNITGSLFLPYCHIDGSFELGGFQFSHGGEEILVNTSVGHDINLQSTKVRRSHTINGVNAKGCFYADFSSVGDNIVFDAIKTQDEYWNTIGGDLSYTGSDVAGTISIRYLKVDIDSRPQRRGISVTGAKIHKDVYLSDTDIRTQLSFIKTQIGGELRVTLPTEKDAFTSHGTPVIDLENIHVGKDLVLKASAELIKFKAANVKGNVRLQGEVKGSVQGRESRVGGSLEFNDVMFKSTFHNDLNQEEHALDWSDAEVGGVLSVKNRDYAAANKDFVVKSWRKPLSCYPDFDYVETLLNRPDGSWIASFLVPKLFWEAPGQHAVLLCNAYSAMFHTLNAAGKLDIDSEAKAREYVKLFCACVWGDDGAFAIIESVDVLPKDYVASIWGHSFDWQQVGPMKRLDLDSVLPNTDQKRIVGAQDIYLFKAYMWYGDALFEAYMLVKRGGLVEMLTHVNLLTFKRTFGAGNTSAIAGVP